MKVYVLSAIQSGFDIFSLIKPYIKVDGYIGLSDMHDRSEVSGYHNAKAYFQKVDTTYYELDTYNLSASKDQELLKSLDIDVLIVGGWQRLIPEWLIEHCKVCAIGSHGSPLGITKGRGRSPQNWALLLGMQSFEIAIFKIDNGIDSGEVIATRKFSYNKVDNIRSSYIKVTHQISKMIVDAIKSGAILEKGITQEDEGAEYLPQRTLEDGMIDWNRNVDDIYNFIRALTMPYPGAYTRYNGEVIKIWEGIPYEDFDEESNEKSGTVIGVFSQGELLIKCGKGALIVSRYENFDYNTNMNDLIIFESSDFNDQMSQVKKRHISKYPELKLSQMLK